MKWFLLIQKEDLVPGMAMHTPIGGGHIPTYRATLVLGPFEYPEDASAEAARRLKPNDVAIMFQGEQIRWKAVGQ